MEIKLGVSKKENLKKLEKLCDDAAFVATILKNMGYNKLPKNLIIKAGIIKPKIDNK